MSEKTWKRLKLLLIVLGVLAFTGYFAFRTFVFDPLEGSFGPIAMVIPRDVDVYLRKTNLGEDFPDFPKPRFFPALSSSEGWHRFLNSSLYQELNRKEQIEEKITELEQQLAQLPIDLMGDLLGNEVVLAGKKNSADGGNLHWALYARVSWKIKLGLGLMRFDSLRSNFAPQIQVQEEGDSILRIKGAMPTDIFVWRDRDLLIASEDISFAKSAQTLLESRGENSLGLSAKYADEIQRFISDAGEYELLVDLEPFVKSHLGPGSWPPARWDIAGRILAELFTPAALQESLSVLRFEDGFRLRTHLELNRDLLTEFQRRFYDQRALNLSQELIEKAKMVPRTSFLFGMLGVNAADFARALERALDENQRRLVNDQLKAAGTYKDVKGFLDEFASAFRSNIYFILRKNDYGALKDDPPHDDSKDALWAIALSVASKEKAQQMIDYFVRSRSAFGIEAVYHFDSAGGFKATEFWSQLIPTTGEIAVLPAGDTFYISNSPKLLKDILKCRFQPTPGDRLSDDESFLAQVAALEPSANAFLYFNTRRFQEAFVEQIPFLAQTSFQMDYRAERAKAREKIIRERYPQFRGKAIPPQTSREIDQLVDEAIAEFDREQRGAGVEKLRRELEDYVLWLSSFPEIFLALQADGKKIDLTAKVSVDWR